MKPWMRRTAVALTLATGLTTGAGLVAGPATAAASTGTGDCGAPITPVLQFDGLGHYVVTVGFSGAKKAVSFAFAEYIEITDADGTTHRHVPTQTGTLFFRSSLTKRHIGTIEPGSSVSVVLGGAYSVVNQQLPCAMWGEASGSWG